MAEETDLTFVDTDALAEELQKRFPLGFVFLAEGEEAGQRYRRRLYNGPPSTVCGMLTFAHDFVRQVEANDDAAAQEDAEDE
jgi:hypothetical protein